MYFCKEPIGVNLIKINKTKCISIYHRVGIFMTVFLFLPELTYLYMFFSCRNLRTYRKRLSAMFRVGSFNPRIVILKSNTAHVNIVNYPTTSCVALKHLATRM